MENIPYFLGGALTTFSFTCCAWVLGMPLSLGIAIARVNRIPILAPILGVYVSFLRSLPLPLLVMLFYFGLPVTGINLDPLVAGVIALALNTSTFNSEIWRSAMLNFPIEQLDAAKAVGMTSMQAFWRITLPQIWRASIPDLTNEATLLIKASPAIGIIGIDDLTRRASKLAASNYEPLSTIAIGMGMYILVLVAVSLFSRLLTLRLHQSYELV